MKSADCTYPDTYSQTESIIISSIHPCAFTLNIIAFAILYYMHVYITILKAPFKKNILYWMNE